MKILVVNGVAFFVNDDVHRWAKKLDWTLAGKGYPATAINGKKEYLHRLIAGAKSGEFVDHRDLSRTNCMRRNLRIASRGGLNLANTRKRRNNTSGFKGVCECKDQKRRKKWIAFICVNFRKINLGRYLTPQEASRAYLRGARRYFGKFARAV